MTSWSRRGVPRLPPARPRRWSNAYVRRLTVLTVAVGAAVLRAVFWHDQPVGRSVNLGSAGFDLIVLSVLVSIVRFRGYGDGKEKR